MHFLAFCTRLVVSAEWILTNDEYGRICMENSVRVETGTLCFSLQDRMM